MKSAVYKSSDVEAFKLLIFPFVLATLALILTSIGGVTNYWAGQFLLSLFFLQTFLLLHECGHLSFFKTKPLNRFLGNIFGFLTMIPYDSWQQVHAQHHKWAGWRDKDPTTRPTAYVSDSNIKNLVVNIAWKIWFPLFYLAYKVGNYWNLVKISKYVPESRFKKVKKSVIVHLVLYVALFIFASKQVVYYVLPAFLLSLVWKELVIMSQHSHVDMPLAEGADVKPFSYVDQVQYTRSFHVPHWISKYVLFNVNLHEAHHAYPGIPAYALGDVDIQEPAEPKFFEWLSKAKSMKGEDYIFRTSRHTGKKF